MRREGFAPIYRAQPNLTELLHALPRKFGVPIRRYATFKESISTQGWFWSWQYALIRRLGCHILVVDNSSVQAYRQGLSRGDIQRRQNINLRKPMR